MEWSALLGEESGKTSDEEVTLGSNWKDNWA
jgi:hypothetical protein